MISPPIKQESFLHKRLQSLVANALFPKGDGDWYKNKGYGNQNTIAFADFIHQQKTNEHALYYKAFKHLNFNLSLVPSELSTQEQCEIEVFKAAPEPSAPLKPGSGKHIIYFPGANTYYQACFRDISTACKETGATVHAFNFPGTGLSTGKVREANDLTNAGLSVVRSLLKQGINPDDIILQGDCYGAGVALEVKEHLKIQADINVRLVMNNAFKSFKAAICDMITQSPWLPHQLKNIVKKLLEFTGWHLTPGKKYRHADPYQCHIQHIGDQTLSTSTLSDKVSRYRSEIFSGQTTSLKREAISDTCPEEYKSDRDILDNKHIVRVKESEKERLGKKFGYDKFGRINAHFADLCELEMLNGQSVYTGYINDYLERSDKYIKNHPQNAAAIKAALNNIHYVHQNPSVEITRQEADEMNLVSELINEAHKIAPIDDFNDNIPTGEPPQI